MRAVQGVATALVGMAFVAGCGGSSAPTPSAQTWANEVCGSFTAYGQSQITARNLLGDAVSGATTSVARQKVDAAATGLQTVGTKIAAVRAALKSAGTPAVDHGAAVIAGLDSALADQATQMTTNAATVRGFTSTGAALGTDVQKLIDTFSEDNQQISDKVAASFENTAGGQTLEKAFAVSTCAKSALSTAVPSPSAS